MKIFNLAVVLFAIIYLAVGAPTDEGDDAEGRGLLGNLAGQVAGTGVGLINTAEGMIPGMGGSKGGAGGLLGDIL